MGLNLNFYVRKNFKVKFTETLILLNITVKAIFYLWFTMLVLLILDVAHLKLKFRILKLGSKYLKVYN